MGMFGELFFHWWHVFPLAYLYKWSILWCSIINSYPTKHQLFNRRPLLQSTSIRMRERVWGSEGKREGEGEGQNRLPIVLDYIVWIHRLNQRVALTNGTPMGVCIYVYVWMTNKATLFFLGDVAVRTNGNLYIYRNMRTIAQVVWIIIIKIRGDGHFIWQHTKSIKKNFSVPFIIFFSSSSSFLT